MHAIIIENVSNSQLSIARFSGGIRINGVDYFYVPHQDVLIKKKYWKQFVKLGYEQFKQFIQNGEKETEIQNNKADRPREKKADPQMQKGLFDAGNMSSF